MQVVRTVAEMQGMAQQWREEGVRIGFVPTMGYLHEGHLSLMRLAKERADGVVVSIFVNPTQFGPNEDLEAYPRDFERDEALCKAAGVDALFYPSAEEMYDAGASVFVDEGALSKGLCGASRAGHFRGVLTVVAKLFNIVLPDVGVFGRKDAQQLRLIEKMVADLNFPVEVVGGDIVREADGLAMSSRNAYLSEEERRDALCLRRALDWAEETVAEGERDAQAIRAGMLAVLEEVERARVDYVEVVRWEDLERMEVVSGDVLIALAVFVGRTRLIDNALLRVDDEEC